MSSDLHNSNSSAYKKAKRLYLKATKNRNPELELDWSPFRASEKKYKARFPPPDLSNVLDLATLNATREHEINQGIWRGSGEVEFKELLGVTSSIKVYMVPRIPGLVILPSFISQERQRELVRWSLCDQARDPNQTSLDTHYLIPKDGIWQAWLRSWEDPKEDYPIHPKANKGGLVAQEPPGPRQLVDNTPATLNNFPCLSATPKPPQAPSATIMPTLASELLYKLRWANIGWFYHWGTKQYDFSKGKGLISSHLRELCKEAVAAVDWKQIFAEDASDWGTDEPNWMTWSETYEPDAGIVNFYQEKDTLMGHVDRSEICATSPLVSISLGNAAVFLIGSRTRESEPIPILLRSGDIVIMSGPECRRAFHGVPRILEGTLPPHLVSEHDDWRPYKAYMQTTRINVNVRQVFPKGFKPPIDKD